MSVQQLKISRKQGPLEGSVCLEGSKSISNRVLIIKALCGQPIELENLSPSDDTATMRRLLTQIERQRSSDSTARNGIASGAVLENAGNELLLDVGAAGTTMRFLTAFTASVPGLNVVMTGSERMKQRPIGILVDALRQLGADITYTDVQGYPPVQIRGKSLGRGPISIRADVSSQYISALLLIAPTLPQGLQIMLDKNVSSRPYIEMTLRMLKHFGANAFWSGDCIEVTPGAYHAVNFRVEGDWSAASYYYSCMALAGSGSLHVEGIGENSLQGDSILPKMYTELGVKTRFTESGIMLTGGQKVAERFAWNFTDCPDLAQTVAVTVAGLGVDAWYSGLESLRIKETDRTAALRTELAKFVVSFEEIEKDRWREVGIASGSESPVEIETYEDHRMAMSFAPLCMITGPLIINDPGVVSKSYASYWSDLSELGFEVSGS